MVLAGLLGLVLLLVACGGRGSDENTLTVLAGSELRDLEPFFDDIRRETDVQLEMTYIGSLEGAEQLLAGADYDLGWFSHGTYLNLLQGGRGLVQTQEKTMLSPVVMGVKADKAAEFGWIDNPNVTWKEIADRSSAGDLRFAMTNPAASNSGFTALVGVATALSGQSDALEVADIDEASLRQFFEGQALTAGSSGWLAESYVANQDRLDGMINYESVLLQLNESGELAEDLVLIYPQEGIITADYPLMLLNAEKQEQYDRLIAYLRTPEVQQQIMETTLRRPVIPGVSLDSRLPDRLLVEIPFPNSVEVIDALLFSYLDQIRVPAHAFFILDTSGSMEGDRIENLKQAMGNLTGMDESLTGRFARFRSREKITLVPFNTEPGQPVEFDITDPSATSPTMTEVRQYVNALEADGDTSIYSTLAETYRLAALAQQADPERYYSIVLLTDGENTAGIEPNQFLNYYNSLPEEARQIRTFTVIFGNADREAMEQIAAWTGGRVFDATAENLALVFKEIRGYQ
jgi:Ca-activated chloride channel family protein